MGNVCCIGRTHQQVPSVHNPQSPVKSSKKLKQLTEIKTTSSPKESNPNLNPTFSEDSESIHQSSHHSDELQNYNTVKIFSNRSEAHNTLKYSIITPEDLSPDQQKQVIKALDKYKDLLAPDEQEMVDGFFHVQTDSSYLMMITTYALYLLNPVDLSDVNMRVELEQISYIILTKTKEFVGFVEKSVKNLIKIKSEDIEDLVKSVQQVNFEAFNQYLPWVVVEAIDKVRDQDVDKKTLMAERNLSICKVIVEHGNIGESVKIIEKCNNSGQNRIMTVFLVLTEECLYMLDSSLGFLDLILFRDVQEVAYKEKENLLEVKGKGKNFGFVVDAEMARKVKETLL